MGAARPLPRDAREAFLSRDSERLGLTVDRLRGADIAHPFRGVSRADAVEASLLQRIRDYSPLLRPGQSFSHTTALALLGVPIPDDGAVHVSVAFPRTPPRGDGVRGHALQRIETALVGLGTARLPASAPPAAWIESAALVSRQELVALGDALLPARGRAGRVTLEELRAAADRVGVPGIRRAQWALPLLRPGVRARPESHLRVAVIAAGLPEPVVEHPIRVAGGLTLHPDLFFIRQRVGLEYEGDGHRTDRRQWQSDIERRELFEAEDVRIIRVTSRDLWITRAQLMHRIARILSARG